MKLPTEADKGNWQDYSLWEIFLFLWFDGEVIFYIISVDSKVSTTFTIWHKVNCKNHSTTIIIDQ